MYYAAARLSVDGPPSLHAAVVGAGLMGRWHAHYVTTQGSTIVAIVDPDRVRLSELGAKYPNASRFTDLETCLARCSVDVVHICTPASTHAELAAMSIQAGTHLLIEKPLALTSAETRDLLDQAASAGVHLCPVHQFPFQRGCRRLRRDLHRLGDPVHIAFTTCSAGGVGRSAIERRDILFEILPHPLSLFQSMLDVDLAKAHLRLTRLTDDDLECIGSWHATRLQAIISLRGRPTRNVLTVTGTEATAHVDLFHGFSVIERGQPGRGTKLLQPFMFGAQLLLAAQANAIGRFARRQYAYPGLAELICAFYQVAHAGTPDPCDRADILAIATAIDDLRQSSPSHQ